MNSRALALSPLSLQVCLPLALALGACQAAPPEPTKDSSMQTVTTSKTVATPPDAVGADGTRLKAAPSKPPAAAPGPRKISAKPVAPLRISPDDPIQGKWTLDDATAGLPKGDKLIATIETDMGAIECTLFPDKAPINVANFVGLARGIRPWKTPEGTWAKKPAYDGTIFHRIIKGFMIQGGDAKKNGTGEAGFVVPDEVWEGATHDRAGLLCMANRGPNTASAQFFITDAAAPHLDVGYTIFGECGPVATIHEIASVPAAREKPSEPPAIKKITVTRK